MNKILLVLTIIMSLTIVGNNVNAQSTWQVDDDKKAEVMTVTFGQSAIDAGKAAYQKFNCKSCHGEPGTNTALPLAPKPTDLGLAAFHAANTDGSIFYKITDGKGAMPSFKSQITETDRWNLVCFIRSFDKNYKGGSTPAVAVNNFKGKISSMVLSYDSASNSLIAKLSASDSTGKGAIPGGVGVEFLVKRQFGYLKLGEKPAKTNAEGIAKMELPKDLPADLKGIMMVKVQLPEGSPNGTISVEQEINTFKPAKWDNPLNHRSMWGTRANTPLWLLFTYVGITLAVWLGIGWVVLQVLRIYSLRER